MQKAELIKRAKSFGWRTAVMVLIALLNWLMENIGLFGLPVWAVGLIGLLAGEGTKWLNNNSALFGKALKK